MLRPGLSHRSDLKDTKEDMEPQGVTVEVEVVLGGSVCAPMDEGGEGRAREDMVRMGEGV